MKLSGDVALEIPATGRLSAEVVRKGLPTLVDRLAGLKRHPTKRTSAYGRAVTFNQKDVRAIQLAKGALRTGLLSYFFTWISHE